MQLLFETIKKQYFKFTFFCFSFSPILTQAFTFPKNHDNTIISNFLIVIKHRE